MLCFLESRVFDYDFRTSFYHLKVLVQHLLMVYNCFTGCSLLYRP